MLIMKEEQKILEVSAEKLRALEEGLLQKVPEPKKKFEHKTNLCARWIRSLHLILLLELMLFLAGSCYIIFQRYSSQVPEDKDIAIAFEKYISILEAQKLHASTEMPEKLVKSDIVADQFNNLLEDVGLIKEQKLIQDKISTTDADSTMRKNTQNFISVENDNTVRASDFNNWPQIRLSLGDFKLNKEFAKDSMPWQFSSINYIDDTTDKNAKIIQFFERLQDIAEIEANIKANLKGFESKNDFTHDTNHLTLNSQENHGPDASNKLKSLKFHVTTISNPEDSTDRRISASLTNNLENWKQKLSDLFSDFFEDATPIDRSEKTSFSDKINKQANNDLEQGYVICLPDQPDESFDMSHESSAKDFSISQSISAQENSEQMENKSNENISARNKDKPNVDDSNVSMSASSDVSTSKSDDLFLFSVLISSMGNIESQHSLEIAANIKADEKRDSTENINDSFESWQDSVKHSTSNDDKFQWSNAPARFADDLQPGPVDISKLGDAKIYPFLSANPETIEDFIPGSECQVQIVIDILMVKCPAVNFDEEWNLAPVETHTSDFLDVNSFESIFDYYDDANNQLEEQLTSQHDVPEVTDTVELQENTSEKILNVPERIRLDVAGDPKVIQDDAVHNSNEEEIRQATTTVSPSSYEIDSDYVDYVDNEKFISWLETMALNSNQQKAVKIEEYDVPDNEHLKTSAEMSDLIASALEKKLASIFNNETKSLIDYITTTKPSSSDYMDAIRDRPPYIWISPSPDSWHQQYDAAKKVVEDIRYREFPYALWDSSNDRKKRMAVTELQSVENTITVENTIEESNENVEVLQNLKKIFQRMEILAAYIDRLHERYLLHSKLDDDYVSSEFPEEMKKRRK